MVLRGGGGGVGLEGGLGGLFLSVVQGVGEGGSSLLTSQEFNVQHCMHMHTSIICNYITKYVVVFVVCFFLIPAFFLFCFVFVYDMAPYTGKLYPHPSTPSTPLPIQ